MLEETEARAELPNRSINASLRSERAASTVKETVPRGLRRVFALEDLKAVAPHHLPRPAFGYVARGAETRSSIQANRFQFEDFRFLPRRLRTMARRSQYTTLFGEEFERPFGIPPMGMSALVAYDEDVVLAKAAQAKDTFAIMSVDRTPF